MQTWASIPYKTISDFPYNDYKCSRTSGCNIENKDLSKIVRFSTCGIASSISLKAFFTCLVAMTGISRISLT